MLKFWSALCLLVVSTARAEKNWCRLASVFVDPDGFHFSVKQTPDGLQVRIFGKLRFHSFNTIIPGILIFCDYSSCGAGLAVRSQRVVHPV